jgi:hypothetical protein
MISSVLHYNLVDEHIGLYLVVCIISSFIFDHMANETAVNSPILLVESQTCVLGYAALHLDVVRQFDLGRAKSIVGALAMKTSSSTAC